MSTIAAQQELEHILAAIAAERGPTVARYAAQSLRRAALEGHVNGQLYVSMLDPHEACAIGHLAMAIGWQGEAGIPPLPGWHGPGDEASHSEEYSSLERYVWEVRPGETAASCPPLAHLVTWIEDWLLRSHGRDRGVPTRGRGHPGGEHGPGPRAGVTGRREA